MSRVRRLDGSAVLRLGGGIATTARAWRAYRALASRYLEALDVAVSAQPSDRVGGRGPAELIFWPKSRR